MAYENTLRAATYQTRIRCSSGHFQPFSGLYDSWHKNQWKVTKEEYMKIKKKMDELIKKLKDELNA